MDLTALFRPFEKASLLERVSDPVAARLRSVLSDTPVDGLLRGKPIMWTHWTTQKRSLSCQSQLKDGSVSPDNRPRMSRTSKATRKEKEKMKDQTMPVQTGQILPKVMPKTSI